MDCTDSLACTYLEHSASEKPMSIFPGSIKCVVGRKVLSDSGMQMSSHAKESTVASISASTANERDQ